MQKPCDQCPWRKSNQGKKHRFGFFTMANLRRLWNQIRGGGRAQSCHLTDPNHPDHVAAGAPENAKPKECPGSVIIVLRECQQIAEKSEGKPIELRHIDAYLKDRKRGLKKKGVMYWLVSRITFGKVSFIGEGELPDVDVDDKEIGLPECLAKG